MSSPSPIKGKAQVSWLHLSDLHIGNSRNDWRELKNALLTDIEQNKRSGLHQKSSNIKIPFNPDLLFITGDIAYRATNNEYKDAVDLLEKIWEITGLNKHRTFIIPGNHDVDRKATKIDPAFASAFNELADPSLDEPSWHSKVEIWWNSPSLRNILQKKFKQYLQFEKKCTAVSTKVGYYTHLVELDNIKLEIIGLNSALMSWQDGEDLHRGLWIGRPQLDEIKQNSSKDISLRIALVHHPREALHQCDVVWKDLQEYSSLVLHGHMHRMQAILMAEPEKEYICLPGGSINQGGKWQSQRYSYGEFNLETKELNLFMRKTIAGSSPRYIRDIETYPIHAQDGHLKITLRQNSE
jgi:predicted MPP superfamily phosphohydrolase